MSLGIENQICFGVLTEVFLDALTVGAIPVAAAGNNGPSKGTVGYPACLPHVVAVGSVSIVTEEPAWFSSRGPGCRIIKPDCASYGGAGDAKGERQPIERVRLAWLDGYRDVRGTSFAAPIVSAEFALALELTKIPTLHLEEVVRFSSRDIWQPGKDNDTGWGVVEADKIIKVSIPSTTIIDMIIRLLSFIGISIPGAKLYGIYKMLRV